MLLKYFICVGYGHELIYAVASDKIVLECISLHVTCCVEPVLICAVTASAAVPYPGAAVLHPAVTSKLVVHELSFASRLHT